MKKITRIPKIDGSIGWYELADNRNETIGVTLRGKHIFDVAIIGAGFTGLSIAERLAELDANLRIAVIDALKVGEGASGRNAGFIIDTPHTLDAKKDDELYSQNLQKLNIFAIDRLKRFKKEGASDWLNTGKYLAAHETRNLKGLHEYRNVLDKTGTYYEWLEGEELAKRLGTQFYQAAIYTKDTILVNPATLVRNYALSLNKERITIFEDSPIINVELKAHYHRLIGAEGEIKTTSVIYAANGFNGEFQPVNHQLIPCFTYGSLTEPIPEDIYEEYFSGIDSWGITSAHAMGSTVRLTSDRRIFIRNKFDYEPALMSNEKALAKAKIMHRDSFNARFPQLNHLKFDYTWGGMVTLTMNSEPAFIDHKDNSYSIVGCNGVGITRGTYLGFYMADYMYGIQSPELEFILKHSQPNKIPSEPLKSIGAHIRFAYEHFSAGKDV